MTKTQQEHHIPVQYSYRLCEAHMIMYLVVQITINKVYASHVNDNAGFRCPYRLLSFILVL